MSKTFFALMITGSLYAGTTYTVTDLGTLAPNYSAGPTAISSNGYVTGYGSVPPSGFNHAFLTTGGQMLDISAGLGPSIAFGVNSRGQVVGQYGGSNGSATVFLYSNGTAQNLGQFGGTAAQAFGINDNGVIAITRTNSNGTLDALLWSGSTLTEIGSGDYVFSLNNSGQATGVNGSSQAYLYSQGIVTPILFFNNGAPSEGEAISSTGQVAGYFQLDNTSGSRHAFLANNGSTGTDLGTLAAACAPGNPGPPNPFGPPGPPPVPCASSEARGVNASGTVVGNSETGDGAQHAFIYSGVVMQDLNNFLATPGWTLTDAVGINDNGQIAAVSDTGHALLLNPVGLNAVPEPGGATLMLLGGAALVALLKSRLRNRVG